MRRLDLTRRRFGKLVAIKDVGSNRNGRIWQCKCDCGIITFISAKELNARKRVSCGCKGKLDLIGLQYGRLFVVDQFMRDSRTICVCRCKCGNRTEVDGSKLKRGDVKSCGCFARDIRRNNTYNRKAFGHSSFKRVFSSYKSNAKYKGRQFQLSEDEARRFFESQCYYCGNYPSTKCDHPKLYGYYVYNGIDRLDNKRGYVVDNCVSCCERCNKKKMTDSYTDFVDWIEQVYHHLYLGGNDAYICF